VRKAVLIALGAVAAFVVLPFVDTFAFYAIDSVAGGCSEGEMRVFREFPQYGGRRLEPDYRAENGCFVAFTTEDQPESVRTYYKEQLTARGWTLDPPPPASKPRRDDPRPEVLARRGAATSTRPYWSRRFGAGRPSSYTSSKGTNKGLRRRSAARTEAVKSSMGIARDRPD